MFFHPFFCKCQPALPRISTNVFDHFQRKQTVHILIWFFTFLFEPKKITPLFLLRNMYSPFTRLKNILKLQFHLSFPRVRRDVCPPRQPAEDWRCFGFKQPVSQLLLCASLSRLPCLALFLSRSAFLDVHNVTRIFDLCCADGGRLSSLKLTI